MQNRSWRATPEPMALVRPAARTSTRQIPKAGSSSILKPHGAVAVIDGELHVPEHGHTQNTGNRYSRGITQFLQTHGQQVWVLLLEPGENQRHLAGAANLLHSPLDAFQNRAIVAIEFCGGFGHPGVD